MQLAIFHDYLDKTGGGERLVLTLARGLDADIITTDVDYDSIENLGFSDVNIISLGPTLKVAPFKQMHASMLFALCDFPDYDCYIFSGNWAHYAAAKHKPNLWYCHTPTRAFYDLKGFTLKNQKTPIHRLMADLWIRSHSYFNLRSISHVSKVVTNSTNTRHRISRYYGLDATVIYPPIPTERFHFAKEGSFWLSVNRLYPEKRVPLQIEAFKRTPEEQLKIVGWYSQGDHSRGNLGFLSDLPDNVEILGSISDEDLIELYAGCKGFLCTAMDEDFGMTPVEAMASGKPVVAVKEGGYLESVVDGVTGILVDPNAESIANAVRKISKEGSIKYKDACIERARLFDESIFLKKMEDAIQSVLSSFI